MSKLTSLKVAHYTGDMDVDNWNKEKWFDEFNENQVRIKKNKFSFLLRTFGEELLSLTQFKRIIFR